MLLTSRSIRSRSGRAGDSGLVVGLVSLIDRCLSELHLPLCFAFFHASDNAPKTISELSSRDATIFTKMRVLRFGVVVSHALPPLLSSHFFVSAPYALWPSRRNANVSVIFRVVTEFVFDAKLLR